MKLNVGPRASNAAEGDRCWPAVLVPPRTSEGGQTCASGFARERLLPPRPRWWHGRCDAMPPMNLEPLVSAPCARPARLLPRHDRRFLIAMGVPLLLLAACGGGQTTGGTGGSGMTGTGGVGGKGSGGAGAVGGGGGVGGN